MANFCPKCGKENKPDDRFCRNCGTGLAESAGSPAAAPKPETPPAPAQANPVRSKPFIIVIIGSIVQLIFWGLLLCWIWYSYGCATGKYPGTGDQTCQWFYSTFSGKDNGDGGNGSNGGGTTCIPTGCGNLWRCNGSYYSEEKKINVDACFTLGNRPDKIFTTWVGQCRQCP
ncbi:MAG: zinc-ribbon domain-containing protein [Candidatus Paceibacterota bacterium]|jgi:hypothetical protein